MSFTVTLTQEQLNTVSKALGEIPFKDAAPILASIQHQLIAAAKAKDAAAKAELEAKAAPEDVATPDKAA